ncbi:calcium-activated potassium channel subunit alpha-1a-like isoform X2 [Dysidea avara]|uniref:calcium-activated potassium channel subunit alpha-1a-like isoform X2 n=1 Tax=Dysidea avara TaxID=196820 RepID=UPI00333493F1
MSGNGACIPDDPVECDKQGVSENYWIYLVTSAVVLIIVYVPVFASSTSLSVYRFFKKAQREAEKVEKNILRPVKITYERSGLKFLKELALGEHNIGNAIIVGSLLVNVAYFALFWRRTYLLAEICLDQYEPEWQIEVVFTTYFICYFCLRLFGGYNRREFWIDLKTFIDLVTIPHIFVSVVVDRDWIGLRFLRILWFNHVIDLFRQFSVFKSQRWIDILSLLSYFITFWIASAGAIYVLEVTGDPWHDFNTRHCTLAFPDYVYFLIVTISTVGYGDISPNTEVGRIFVSFLIILGIVLIAYATPTISELFESYSQYSGSYTQVTDAKHVVVSGHINSESVRYFLSDFLHPDRKDRYTKVLVLHPKEPDRELKAVIRKYFRRVKYFKGSVLSSIDLERVKLKKASAAVILSPNYCLNPVSEDESNLMRVVSIKNTCNDTKVIVQVLQVQSLQQLVRIPSWHPSVDTAICKSELKLGLMAQNCLCPGISTLLSNLMYTTSESASGGWQLEYMKGAGNEVYKEEIPEAFYGMLYEDVVLQCFMNPQLKMMLIAIDASPISATFKRNAERIIYPTPFGFKLDKGMYGYFIAQDEEQVSALQREVSPGKFVATRSQNGAQRSSLPHQHDTPLVQIQVEASPGHNNLQPLSPTTTSSVLYHKCPDRNIEEVLLQESTNLTDHVVLCTFSEKDSDELNLHSFVSPLRSCTLQLHELKPIVIIGNKDCIQAEWNSIAEFDKVFVIDGSPLDQDTLKAANVAHCSSCLILGSTRSLDEDPALIDKQPILCSLTLSTLDFGMPGKALKINKVTELYREENVEFLDLGDDDDAASFIASQPFAQGECISSTVFDSLVAVAYFNPGATALFEKLVTGGSVNQAKAKQIRKTRRLTYTTSSGEKPSFYRPRFLLISLERPEYEQFCNQIFAMLFESFLEEKKLCIGIYRCIDPDKASSKRFVITLPEHDMVLMQSDQIFVLVSFK